jgi:hypothetical protein
MVDARYSVAGGTLWLPTVRCRRDVWVIYLDISVAVITESIDGGLSKDFFSCSFDDYT